MFVKVNISYTRDNICQNVEMLSYKVRLSTRARTHKLARAYAREFNANVLT